MKFTLLLITVSFSFSCQSNKSQTPVDSKNPLHHNKSLEELERQLHQKLTDALHLPRIDSGVDSFELRVFSKMALINFNLLTILRFEDSRWYLTETIYWQKPIDDLNTPHFSIDSMTTKWTHPQLPYNIVIDSLINFRLDTLPTQQLTSNFKDNTADGTAFTIELARKNFYKLLIYRNPKYYQEINHQKVNFFLNFCSRNLGVWKL